ncbi:YfhO family protein [Prolixibacter denitrificans]|uniref:Membrane protein YfhO n=1 Tax=Prolixibacter denitrificans TaxID=1541063 RepID=A0A2P8CH98_9BACT|nr:YfhO family protein [Prolixibacter denitrificans]PSK84289.1 membrane protein YfhO [Prolixibacter denitrificans]GET20464.1 hypothetical protein JCM18694_07100 [Prolixibacter denitrificans]
MQLTRKKTFLILLVAVLSAFWQVAFFRNTLKWDALDISFPWRFIITATAWHGELPLWNPFQFLGFSQHSDPQTWYPIFWLFALAGKYTLYSLSLEFLLHIFLAGWGMFRLSRSRGLLPEVALFCSIGYMLSGFFVGNAQHLGWIVSGTWLPFVLEAYLLFLKKGKPRHLALTVLYLFFLFTGGYLAFFVTTVYILIGIFLWRTYREIRNKKFARLASQWKNHLLLGVLFAAVSAVVWVSLLDLIPAMHRGNGISLERALSVPFYPIDLLSLFFPAAQNYSRTFWIGDQSMINVYLGILPMMLFVAWIFAKGKKRTEWWYFAAAIFFLAVSLGQGLPLRTWLYYALPLFNYFRIPALFRLFFVFFSLLLAGSLLNRLIKYDKRRLGQIMLVSLFVFPVFVALLLYTLIGKLENESLHAIFRQALLQEVLIFVLWLTINRWKKKNWRLVLPGLIFIDMLFAVQSNIHMSVIDDFRPTQTQAELNRLPKGFPFPDLNQRIATVRQRTPDVRPLWRNVPTFYKQISFDGYSPYQYRTWLAFEDSSVFRDVIDHPLLYFRKENDNDSTQISITGFGANYLEADVSLKGPSELIYLQNFKNGWQAFIDGKATEIQPAYKALMKISVPTGEHHIRFRYHPTKVLAAFAVSAISFLLLLVWLLWDTFLRKRKKKTVA